MKVGMQRYADQYSGTDFLLFEPEKNDTEMFFTNVFSYADRQRLCEHAYQVTRRQLQAQRAELAPALERCGLSLNDAHLLDPERSYQTGMQGPISSTNPISGRLTQMLGELESYVETQKANKRQETG
jgi:NTE family protein